MGEAEGLNDDKETRTLAFEHWEFIRRWLEMAFMDAFIHGYKHGRETKE